MAGNILQMKSVFSKVGKQVNKKPKPLPPPRGNEEWEAEQKK